ncbi:MAG: methyl-accepting chemotaxis protein, partial [Pseudomonadota bacterium]
MSNVSPGSSFDLAQFVDLSGFAHGQTDELGETVFALVEASLPEVAEHLIARIEQGAQTAVPHDAAALAGSTLAELLRNAEQPEWLSLAARWAQMAARAGAGIATLATANAMAWQEITQIIRSTETLDAELVNKLCEFVACLSVIHSSVISDAAAKSEISDAHSSQRENADMFEMDISSTAHIVADQTAILAEEMEIGANLVDNVLEKTAEVSGASEQSASAMREAAKTTNSLLRGVQKASEEIAVAAESAKRASQQAKESAGSMKALEEQSKSIGSVLKLIGEIAEQTNILALNATIEAARAGDAGLGFAVVAKEVKSLADQTANATKEVSASVQSIREAAELSVASNASICDKVDQVQELATDISGALSDQEKYVSQITQTVDETAASADQISAAVTDIR